MANITKAFNFRNGVQVDDDNLIVNQTGLVGIGTTIPTEALDVRGKVSVLQDPSVAGSGLINATSGIITTLTVTDTLIVNNANVSTGQVGEGVAVGSPAGIVTATSGIVTYFGDGQFLENIPTSQWENINVGLGYTSIYAKGNVGVNTVDPRFSFQVGGNNTDNLGSFAEGVGINSTGGIVATGVITASSLKGDVLGNISSGISTISQIESDNTNVTGIVTAGIGFTGDIRGNVVSGISTITNIVGTDINVAGIVTAGIGFTGSLTGNVTGNVLGDVTGNLNSGISTSTRLDVTYINSSTSIGVVTTGSINSASAQIGISTASLFNISDKLGIGINTPSHEIEVLKVGLATVTVIGTDVARINLGQKLQSNTGIGESIGGLRFGATSKSLDIFNGDSGDINSYIHLGSAVGVNTGSFRWFHKANNNVMTLTYDGKLGINKENPEAALDVIGVSTFTGNVKVTGNLEVTGAFAGNAAIPDIINGSNINTTTGVSTFNNISVGRVIGVSTVAIGTAFENVVADIDAQLSTALVNKIGIGTTAISGKLHVEGSASIKNLGIGTNSPRCAVDFRDAGGGDVISYMLPPRVTTAIKNTLPTISGAFIYNSSVNKLEVYDGTSWTPLEANSGGGEVNQNAFSNIAVSGQTTVEADAKQDTVTFVAGSNMTITTNATGDEITFASSGGGGGGGGSQTLDDVLTTGNTTSTDIITTGKIYYGNVFSTLTDLQNVSPATYHGMFAHVHATGKGYFSHAGQWIELLDATSAIGDLANVNLSVAPTDGQSLVWDNANQYWKADTISGGGGILSVTGTAPIVSSQGLTSQDRIISIDAATQSAAGSMSASDKTKLDNIELNSTADQTDAEIKTAYENNSDTNAFTDSEKSKLSNIELNATADQTSTEIKALLAGDNLTDAHLAQNSVGSSEIKDDAVGADQLADTSVSAGAYTNANITVDAQGRLTSAESGTKKIESLQGTTSQINDDAYAELNITGFKVYSLFKIATNHDALVRVYVDAASRSADTTRSEAEDPNPGIGLIAEARTSGGTVLVTPGAMGFNNDNPQQNIIYLGVTNRSGSPQQIQVTLTAIQIGE